MLCLRFNKSFIWPHLGYTDITYDPPKNGLLRINLERIQYNSVLAITGSIRSTARDKIFKDLGVETLQSRRKLNPLCTFHKIKTTGLPLYLFTVTKDTSYYYLTRSVKKKKKFSISM